MFTKFKKCSWFLKYGENILMNNFEENFLIMSNSVLYLMKQILNLMNIFELDEQKFYTRKNKLEKMDESILNSMNKFWILWKFSQKPMNKFGIWQTFLQFGEQIFNFDEHF